MGVPAHSIYIYIIRVWNHYTSARLGDMKAAHRKRGKHGEAILIEVFAGTCLDGFINHIP